MYSNVNYFSSINDFKNLKHNNTKTYLIFLTEANSSDLDDLNKLDFKFFGGIFPTVIFKNETYDTGFMVFELKDNLDVVFFEDIDNYLFDKDIFSNAKSILTILDGFSEFNSSFLENIFEELELNTNIIGGGAGILTDPSRKVIFDNYGLYKNAAILILLKEEIDIGVGHGWEILEGPFVSTNVKGKSLKQIDYRNALDVYKEIVEPYIDNEITRENFLDVAKDYPLGVVKFNGESLVRDPVDFKEDGTLILAGDIQSNSVINVLKGHKKSIIKDACKAGKSASKSGCDTLMMFECVSRLNYLGSEFEKEIDLIIDESSVKDIFGVVSIGEIANDGNRYIYFLNKSCVVGGICL